VVLGHEALAQGVEIGDLVDRVEPRNLVVSAVRRPCSHSRCVACRCGRPDFRFTGDYAERGQGGDGYSFRIEDEAYLTPLPHKLRDVGV
jgi:threonine dehydrogenase-like Zn-dependent dehydrogenase